MGKNKVFTVTQVSRKPTLFKTAVPFEVTLNGKVIAQVVKPGRLWRSCEHCGENTQNIIEFQDESFKWRKIVLCDKCSNEIM